MSPRLTTKIFLLYIVLLFFSIAHAQAHAHAAGNVKFHLLKDSRLCNNGDTLRYNTTMCRNPGDIHEFPCDTRKLEPEDCKEAALDMEKFTSANLMELLPTVDTDLTIRRIVIKIEAESVNVTEVGKEIDAFLTERLWWYAHKEPFHWNKHSHRIVVLDRITHDLEQELRKIAALQFPADAEVCAKSALQLNHHDFYHPGWYSMLAVYSIVHGELPYAITSMYVSSENKPDDNAAFITGSECPTVINKWECAFLPTTNCPVPSAVTGCTGSNCVHNSIPDTRWSSVIFDSASLTGKPLKADTSQYNDVKARSMTPPDFNEKYTAECRQVHKFHHPRVKYIKPFHADEAPFQSMMNFDLNELYTYSLTLRLSAYYRSRIAEAIKGFRTANNFTASDRCVAAQVRRGDRAMPGVNITEFCLKPENRDSDMGCANVPFASVSLTHIVDSAAKLVDPTVRSIIVTTDDEEWLDQQRKVLRSTRPDWQVFNLRAPTHSSVGAAKGSDDSYAYMRYGAGTASGVLLHGSIELSRQCEAFVGHFGCGGTMLVYKSMCTQHNHREYVCPPAFDVRTIKELIIPH